MILRIKPDSKEVMGLYLANPKKRHKGDAGFDLIIPQNQTAFSRSTVMVNHHIKCEMVDEDGNFLPYLMMARSSISKTPLMLHNSVGLIDAEYRGNLYAALFNTSGVRQYKIERGSRLVQIVLPTLEYFDVEFVESLSETERGEGGFGSTGK